MLLYASRTKILAFPPSCLAKKNSLVGSFDRSSFKGRKTRRIFLFGRVCIMTIGSACFAEEEKEEKKDG